MRGAVSGSGGERLNASARDEAWVRFAATMLLIGAAANALYGVVGLLGDDHLVPAELIFGALEFWGGVNLVIGLIQFMVALLILTGAPSRVFLGVLVTGINLIAQMMIMGVYPLWSATVLVIDVLIIYALVVHGSSERT